MLNKHRGHITKAALAAATALLFSQAGVVAQTTSAPAKASQSTSSATAEKGERWLHVHANGVPSTVRANYANVEPALTLLRRR